MDTLNVDDAIDCVNKIIDNVRCATCDKLDGFRVRYPCGHSACEDCNVFIEYCPSCTPQQRDAPAVPDYALTQYVEHATALYKAARNLFHPDAFQRKRISEQLKIEKELFPECIQAPVKYENTRKSVRHSLNKENKHTNILPGEAVSSTKHSTMEKTTYVQQWFSKNEKELGRKPFADLNVNTQRNNNSNNKAPLSSRKRSHFKTTHKYYSRIDNPKQSIYQDTVSPKKAKRPSTFDNIIGQDKCDNDESGVFMDSELIVIDDSQEVTLDKDRAAWLAVLQADKQENLPPSSLLSASRLNHTVDIHKQIESSTYKIKPNSSKVPFIKRSAIYETCKYCQNELKTLKTVSVKSDNKHVQRSKREMEPVNISIDTSEFLTTVTVVTDVEHKQEKHMNTVGVQTETSPPAVPLNNDNIIQTITSNICYKDDSPTSAALNTCREHGAPARDSDVHSEDLFTEDRNIFSESIHKAEISKCVIIEESDSDTDLEASGPRSVQAVVHRSCEQIDYGILTDVVNVKEHGSKARRGPRGRTPASTDSSEKENYDPNRVRQYNAAKKKLRKK